MVPRTLGIRVLRTLGNRVVARYDYSRVIGGCWTAPSPHRRPQLTRKPGARFRAKREHLKGLLPESKGQNMALTVLYAPDSLGSRTVLGGAGC